MKMRINREIRMLAILAVSGVCLTGCAEKKKEADFSGINSVCELATLKCYYHNVAKAETKASGLLKWLGTGYKKIWTRNLQKNLNPLKIHWHMITMVRSLQIAVRQSFMSTLTNYTTTRKK